MQIDCDYATEQDDKGSQMQDVMVASDAQASKERPVIRLHGINAQGNSVSAYVYNF
jgi:hypothetical protein